jgi:pectate lyase
MIFNRVSVPSLALAAAVGAAAVAPGLLLSPAAAATKAFPGAEGFGTDTPGGRGGTVCKVVNLNDSGPGSLRSCIEASGPRYVVFRTGGTIALRDRLTITNPYITIAGQTAPGGGVTLRMDPTAGTDQGTMQVATHDVVVRYVRFRPGNGGAADDSNDAMTIYKAGVRNVVVDHCSFSWAVDENVNTYDASTDITVSNSIIAEGLSDAGHPDGEHSKGMLSGGVDAHNVSIHHNLFVSNVDRNPQVSGVSVADVRNNVVYNYGDGSGNGITLLSSSKGEPQMNWVGNYYKPGPSSDPTRAEFATYNGSTGETHQWYGEGNMRWTPSGLQAARIGESVGRVNAPFAAAAVTTTSAEQAYADVLATAGASHARDAVDERLVEEVRSGTGSLTNSTGAYPALAAGTPPADTDGDAMPDAYESAHGTDPGTADAVGDVDGNGYDNIEDWFNSLGAATARPPAPSGTILIDGGAARTGSTAVSLHLTAHDPASGVAGMRFSNDGTTYSAWAPYAATAPWRLTNGDGPRTVWAQFQNTTGNVSAVAADTITLDVTAPGVRKVRPARGAIGVDRDATIKVRWTEALLRSSVETDSVVLKEKGSSKKVEAKISHRADKNLIRLDPKGNLGKRSTYRVLVRSTIKDAVGNSFDAKPKPGAQPLRWRFKTS